MKKAAFFFAEVLGFTLLLRAVAALLFGLPLNNMVAQVGLWFVFGFIILLPRNSCIVRPRPVLESLGIRAFRLWT
jgi:hypothetical protein